jgi:thiol-disulfide isomerase/thioredoxin
VSGERLTRWQARALRRATPGDGIAIAAILALAITTVASGRQARLALSPAGARETSRMLDDLELPTTLLDARLLDPSGVSTTLFEAIHERRAAVAFYAPWCGPCQKELPELAAAIPNETQLIVVVSKGESVEDTRQQLGNLGLGGLRFYVDASERLFKEGRVTALPTTVLISRHGAVLGRGSGYSQLEMRRMRQKMRTTSGSASKDSDDGGAP